MIAKLNCNPFKVVSVFVLVFMPGKLLASSTQVDPSVGEGLCWTLDLGQRMAF